MNYRFPFEVDEATKQILEEFATVPIEAIKVRNTGTLFYFQLLGPFIPEPKRVASEGRLLTIHAFESCANLSIAPGPLLDPNSLQYLVYVSDLVKISSGSKEEKVTNGAKENGDADDSNKGKYPLGAGRLQIKEGTFESFAKSRELILTCHRPNPVFSGVELLAIQGQSCFATLSDEEQEVFVRGQRGNGNASTVRKLELRIADLEATLKRSSSNLRSAQYSLATTKRLMEDRESHLDAIENRWVKMVLDQQIREYAGSHIDRDLLYKMAHDFVVGLKNKGECTSQGISFSREKHVVVPHGEYLRMKKASHRDLVRLDDEVFLDLGSIKDPTQHRFNQYYSNFSSTFGKYYVDNKDSVGPVFTLQLPIPAWMLKLISIERLTKTRIPRISPNVLSTKFGFSIQDIETCLEKGYLSTLDSVHLSWPSIQGLLSNIYPFVELNYNQFLSE